MHGGGNVVPERHEMQTYFLLLLHRLNWKTWHQGMLCIQLATKILFHCGIHIKKKLTNLLLVQSLS